MTVQHADLTGADLHESKGVASAGAGTVYVADGAGSGTWTNLEAANLDFSAFTDGNFVIVTSGVPDEVTLNNANQVALFCYIADIGTTNPAYVVSPIDGTILAIWSVIYTSVNADTTLTASIGGVNVTDGVITVTAAGSAAGDVDSAVPSANNDVVAGQAIRILSDGAAAGPTPAMITIGLDVS